MQFGLLYTLLQGVVGITNVPDNLLEVVTCCILVGLLVTTVERDNKVSNARDVFEVQTVRGNGDLLLRVVLDVIGIPDVIIKREEIPDTVHED